MFGFISSPCANCAKEAMPVWRGTFCGLARCLAREYGAPARVLVNRDAAFVGLLGMAIDPIEPTWKPATCCNPLARPFPVADGHPAIEHAAAVTLCGLAAKLADDCHDEKGLRRNMARLGSWAVSPMVDRAIALLNSSSFPTHHVLETLSAQGKIESRDPARAETPTATAYGEITGHLAPLVGAPYLREILHRVGSALGALVYWRDAWQDREADARHGRFNPFAAVPASQLRPRVSGTWQEFSTALAALPISRHARLLENLRRSAELKHSLFLQTSEAAPPQENRKKQRKRREKKEGSNCWCDACGNCHGCDGCCDCLCDTGARDSGCIDCGTCDCNCCPCD